jgi:anti-anti-sigma regulatory factor
MISHDARLVLCNLPTAVWGTLLVTGLDKIFHFSNDVTTSLATLQMR